jgi:hypothetical protein
MVLQLYGAAQAAGSRQSRVRRAKPEESRSRDPGKKLTLQFPVFSRQFPIPKKIPPYGFTWL